MINHIYSATKYDKAVSRLNDLQQIYEAICSYVIIIGKTVKTNKGFFKRKSLYDLAMKRPNHGGRVDVCKYICDALRISIPAAFTLFDSSFKFSNGLDYIGPRIGADYISVTDCKHAYYINMVLDDEKFETIKRLAEIANEEVKLFYKKRLGDFNGYLIMK